MKFFLIVVVLCFLASVLPVEASFMSPEQLKIELAKGKIKCDCYGNCEKPKKPTKVMKVKL